MHSITRIGIAALCLWSVSGTANADTFALNPAALRFDQIDLRYEFAQQELSGYSWVGVSNAAAFGTLPLGSEAFVNIQDESGDWVVRNLPVNRNWDSGGMSTMFDMKNGIGQRVTNYGYRATISSNPQPAFPVDFAGGIQRVDPGRQDHNAEGAFGDAGDGGSVMKRNVVPLADNRVDLAGLVFNPVGPTSLKYQFGHPNIEQDTDQCYPAAIANSMGYLNAPNTPARIGPGIRDTSNSPSLVGMLDIAMNRPAHRPTPSAVDMIEGKLRVLSDNNIDLMTTHKQAPGIGWLNGTQMGGRFSSTEDTTATPILDWIIDQINANKDVEVRIGWDRANNFGHAVQIIGAGRILGRPYLIYGHDAKQGFTVDMPPVGPPGPDRVAINGGTGFLDGGIGFSWVDPTDNSFLCFIGGRTGKAVISFAIAEVIPAPSAAALLGLMGLVASRRRRA